MMCIPIIVVENKYLPQLIGKFYIKGPLIPNLETMDWRILIPKRRQITKVKHRRFKKSTEDIL